MGRPRPADAGVDRAVPQPPSKKKRRLSDGAAATPEAKQGARHGKPAAAGAALCCPAAVTRALGRAVEAQQRLLCVLLSDAPDAALAELVRGWKASGGKGKCCVLASDTAAAAASEGPYPLLRQQQPQLRTVPSSALAAVAPTPDGGLSASILGPKLGCAIVSDPLTQLTPRTLAALAQSLQGGGMLVLVLLAAAAWEEVLSSSSSGSSASPLALLLGRALVRLPQCKGGLLVLDGRLEAVQPLSTALKASGGGGGGGSGGQDEEDMSLEELQASLRKSPVVGDLVKLARTADQARVLLSFFEPASERSLAGTVSVTGPPGRGKSAAVGLCLAGAVAYGYSNVFLTAASLKAAQPIFRFLLKGFDALGYEEGKDYELIQATEAGGADGSSPSSTSLLLRVNLFKAHRQTVQFLHPEDAARLHESQAEVLAIDDAASLDPELARRLLGPYLLLVASTVGGAGGAGPSAAAALAERLRTQASTSAAQAAAAAAAEVRGSQTKKGERRVHEERWRKAAEAVSALGATRAFVPVAVEAPVHWSPRDPLERWVSRTLGLGIGLGGGAGQSGTTPAAASLRFGTPAPWDCELYRLNRRTLLSGHGVTELLLERVLAVYGAWDWRRDPDALLRLAEPDHNLLALLGPDAEAQGEREGMPDILAVVHVRLARRAVMPEEQGQVQEEAEETVVAEVVHMATHPDVLRMGYGSRALRLLGRYLRGEIGGAGHAEGPGAEEGDEEEDEAAAATPITEAPRPRQQLPPVLVPLEEAGSLLLSSPALPLEARVPRVACVENVPTAPAWSLRFWGKAGFRPVAMQEEDEQGDGGLKKRGSGKATVRIALSLVEEDPALQARTLDFQTRVLRLLPSLYAGLGVYTALGLVERPELAAAAAAAGGQLLEEAEEDEGQEEAKGSGAGDGGASLSLSLSAAEQAFLFTGHDLRRLEMYARSLVDHGMVADLLPLLGQLFFQGRLPGATRLPALQQAVLLGLGMQRKPLEALAREVQLPPHQVLALFNKAVRRLSGALQAIQEAEVEREMAASRRLTLARAGAKQQQLARAPEEGGHGSLPVRLEEEMEAGAKESLAEMRRRQEEALRSLDLMQYAVKGSAEDWEEVLSSSKGALATHGMVQIKSLRPIADPASATYGLPPGSGGGDGGDAGERRLGKKARKGRMEGAIWDVDEDDRGQRRRGGGGGGKKKQGGGGGGRRR